jgi:MFS family permease
VDHPDPLHDAPRPVVGGHSKRDNLAESQRLKAEPQHGACALGRVAEAPGVAAEAVAELGLALAIANGAGLVGAMANGRLVARFGFGPTFLVAAVIPGVGVLLLPLATPGTALLVLASGLGLAGFAIAVYNVNQITLRQVVTPPPMQGRMNATIRVIIWGTIPIGAALGGFLGNSIGLRPTLLVAGIGSVLACSPLLFSRVGKLQAIPEAEEEAVAAGPAEAVPDPAGFGAIEG